MKVGDEVKKGDVLARVDDEDARTQLAQAKRALQELTSDSAVATALGDIATAQATLDKAKGHLAYLISPNVYHWENELANRQEVLADAQANLTAKPEDETLKEAVATAAAGRGIRAEEPGRCAVQLRHTYIKNNFTVTAYVDKYTGKVKKYVEEPSEAEILTARADVAEGEAAVAEANYHYAALTGGEIPADATGSSLTALEQAKTDVQTAQSALDGTTIVATIDGTVMSVDTTVGRHGEERYIGDQRIGPERAVPGMLPGRIGLGQRQGGRGGGYHLRYPGRPGLQGHGDPG